MKRRDNLARLVLAGAVALVLTLLMVGGEVQARIAFSSDRDGNFLHFDIYVMDTDGGNSQNLTNNPSDDWSPDGERIAFASERDGNREIYVIDADGSNPRRLTENDNFDGSSSWSPDGERIAFRSGRAGHFRSRLGITDEIYVMDADGNNQRRLTNNRHQDLNPSWSPDGTRITFSSDREGNFEIYVMAATGRNPQNLTSNPKHDVSPGWFNSPFSVSPRSRKFTMWGWLKGVDR